MKLGILLSNIGPYHRARLEATSRLGQISVIDCGAQHSQAYEVVSPQNCVEIHKLKLNEGGALVLPHVLERVAPDVLAIAGWSFWHAQAGLSWALKQGVPTVVFSDSMEHAPNRRVHRELVKRRLVPLFDAALVGGRIHMDYMAKLGLPRERCFVGLDVVDNQHFTQGADSARRLGASFRSQLALPENYFLAVSRLDQNKNLSSLIRAYARYREISARKEATAKPWELVIVGAGPLYEDLRSECRYFRLDRYVHLLGARSYFDLPTYYGLASVFILPSMNETWGLVVNEAMAAGLPVLVSKRCGCIPDLLQDGVNGFTFDPEDTEQLALLMSRSSYDEVSLFKMADAGRRIIADWDVGLFAMNIWHAARKAANSPHRRHGIIERLLLSMLVRRRAA